MIPARGLPEWLSKTDSAQKKERYITTTWVNSNGPLAFVNGIKDLKAVTRAHTITLFKMDGKDSPYKTTSLLIETKVVIPGQTITPDQSDLHISDAFSYIFLIRNFEALEHLE